MRLLRLVATTSALVAASSCSCGWRYHVRRPTGEPLAFNSEHFATTSLAGGRVDYAIRATWANSHGVVESIIRNRASEPLRVRSDHARFVTASGLALAPSRAGESRAPRTVVTTAGGPSAVGSGATDAQRPALSEVIELPFGSEIRIERAFGPMSPSRGCAPEPDLGSVTFVDDGFSIADEPVEARFTLRRN